MADNAFRGENSGGGGGVGGGGRHGPAPVTGPNGVQSFLKFIETHCPTACVPVDLLKIARNVGVKRGAPTRPLGGGGVSGRINHHHQPPPYHPHNIHQQHHHPGVGPPIGGPSDYCHNGPRLCLILDGEGCLDRLYGGFFSDWVCGGQWNRMIQFLAVLNQTIRTHNIDITVFFNGGLESQRMAEWVTAQHAERRKVSQVLRHLDAKGTPPPKVWWSAPVCLRTCLLLSLRHLEVPVVVTMDDHRQEVIAYCRENNFHGLVAEDAVYAIFDPPRYFSSQKLKLTYKGSLETKEFILDEVASKMDLHPKRFCVFAALLGNCLLTEADLADFFAGLPIENRAKATSDVYIKAVCDFVRGLSSVDNLDVVGAQIFGGNRGRPDPRLQKFKSSVQYYLNGTKDGFLRYRPSNVGRKEPSHYVATWSTAATQPPHNDVDLGKFASETQESEFSSLSAYKEVTTNRSGTGDGPDVFIDPSHRTASIGDDSNLSAMAESSNFNSLDKKNQAVNEVAHNGCAEGSSDLRNGSAKSGTTSNRVAQVNGGAEPGSSTSSNISSPAEATTSSGRLPQSKMPGSYSPSSSSGGGGGGGGGGGYPHQPQPAFYLPTVQPEVMRTASERHQKGLMTPWILQVLTHGEFKLPVCLEEDVPSELPSSAHLYRPIRQMVYAILFNLHHLQYQVKHSQEMQSPGSTVTDSEETVPDILVKEWVWTKYNPYRSPELVRAEPLGWPVPTVQRLWFGNNLDDKKRRLRAFFTCMHSDHALMLNTSYVPQHLLVMCCVLRYVLAQSSSEMRILRNHELNAFLAQAVSPRLMDAQYMQQVQLPVVSSRSVQLAALFMRGVETALFANDACGSPIPWLMCCPWLFFDGKLLHLKLHEANESKDLLDLCEGQSEQVLKVERMRQAILKGLKVEFARRPLPDMTHNHHHAMGMAPTQYMPAGAHWPNPGRSRGNPMAGRRAVVAQGGQLAIAGVVVGSWGANFGTNNRGGRAAGSAGGSGGSANNNNGASGGAGGASGNGNVGGAGGNGSGSGTPQVTSVGGPKRGKPGYIRRYGMNQSWFTGAPMGHGQPFYSIRRPPSVVRRALPGVSYPTQNARKNVNKAAGAKGGVKAALAAANLDAQGVRKVKSSGDKSSATGKQLIKTSATTRNGAAEEKLDDVQSGGSLSAAKGASKLAKSSPTIMKKPSVDEEKSAANPAAPIAVAAGGAAVATDNDLPTDATVSDVSGGGSIRVNATCDTSNVGAAVLPNDCSSIDVADVPAPAAAAEPAVSGNAIVGDVRDVVSDADAGNDAVAPAIVE